MRADEARCMVKDTIPLEDGPAGPGILDVLVGPAPPNSAARRAPEVAHQRPTSAADAFYPPPPRPRRLGQSRAEFRPRRLRASMRRMALQDKANTGRRGRMAHPWGRRCNSTGPVTRRQRPRNSRLSGRRPQPGQGPLENGRFSSCAPGRYRVTYPGLASPGFIEALRSPSISMLCLLSGVGQPRLH